MLTFVQGKYSLEVRSDTLASLSPRSSLTPLFSINKQFKQNELNLRSNAALEALNVDKRV